MVEGSISSMNRVKSVPTLNHRPLGIAEVRWNGNEEQGQAGGLWMETRLEV